MKNIHYSKIMKSAYPLIILIVVANPHSMAWVVANIMDSDIDFMFWVLSYLFFIFVLTAYTAYRIKKVWK